ncbi:MAG: hypothetical protein V3S55_15245 [Nitrospiraceae bacterium]
MTEDPKAGQTWVHRNGIPYVVLFITNTEHETPSHPPDVIYVGMNGSWWSRPLSDWHRSFTISLASDAI